MLNKCFALTAGDLPVRERQQGGVQWMLGVSQDGVPPVHLLHDIWVHTVLLREARSGKTVKAAGRDGEESVLKLVLPWCPWWAAESEFLWGFCCLWLPVWQPSTSWPRSASWCRRDRNAYVRTQWCSSNLRRLLFEFDNQAHASTFTCSENENAMKLQSSSLPLTYRLNKILFAHIHLIPHLLCLIPN